MPRMLRQMCSQVWGQMGVTSSVDTCKADPIGRLPLLRSCLNLSTVCQAQIHPLSQIHSKRFVENQGTGVIARCGMGRSSVKDSAATA